jgi:hypothetical protein
MKCESDSKHLISHVERGCPFRNVRMYRRELDSFDLGLAGDLYHLKIAGEFILGFLLHVTALNRPEASSGVRAHKY